MHPDEEKTGGPAFPSLHGELKDGMTLRDWFAGQALIGILSYGTYDPFPKAAKLVYQVADEMLKARDAK